MSNIFLPAGIGPDAKLLLIARGLRAFGDGCVSLLLPYYLTLLGYSAFQIGAIITATLFGSGITTLAVGLLAHRFRQSAMLRWAALMMMATGIGFVVTTAFWPLLLVAAAGTLNPSSGDVSLFNPLEYAMLTRTTGAEQRTALFARYSLVGGLVGALGAQTAGLSAVAERWLAVTATQTIQVAFLFYGLLGLGCLLLYRRLSPQLDPSGTERTVPLGVSKRKVYALAALFSLDSFGSGFAVQSLLALWLFKRFDLSIAVAGSIFFWTGILSAASQFVSVALARRIGLINTMIYTHLPANIFLMLVPLMPTLPLALLFLMLRHAFSSMDVPVRNAYVMSAVTPGERAAAASVTAVPRSLSAAISPMAAGALLAWSSFGWQLIIGGILKVIYDIILLAMYRKRPPGSE